MTLVLLHSQYFYITGFNPDFTFQNDPVICPAQAVQATAIFRLSAISGFTAAKFTIAIPPWEYPIYEIFDLPVFYLT